MKPSAEERWDEVFDAANHFAAYGKGTFEKAISDFGIHAIETAYRDGYEAGVRSAAAGAARMTPSAEERAETIISELAGLTGAEDELVFQETLLRADLICAFNAHAAAERAAILAMLREPEVVLLRTDAARAQIDLRYYLRALADAIEARRVRG